MIYARTIHTRSSMVERSYREADRMSADQKCLVFTFREDPKYSLQ
jgi:hypothetical protein